MGAIVSSQGGTISHSPSSGRLSDRVVLDSEKASLKNEIADPTVKWKVLPSADEAKEKFIKDGSLQTGNTEQLELRMMLDDPIAQR